MVLRSLRLWLAALVILAIALVPVWQAAGHAPTGIMVAAIEQADTAHNDAASFASSSSGQHNAVDHAHELPIIRSASWVPAGRSTRAWLPLTPPAYRSVAPARPDQPPRP